MTYPHHSSLMSLANGKKNFIATDYAWGQALPSRKDIFRTLAPMAFPRIRPDP